MATPKEFAVALLNRLGLEPTKNRIIGLVDFAAREGGHWVQTRTRYNPMNTGLPMSGAKNAVGAIKAYTSWGQGIEATARTLLQSNMSPILKALKLDADPHVILKSVTMTPWCPQPKPGEKPNGCEQYDVGDPNALYLSYANRQDNGTSMSTTGAPVSDWLTQWGPWLLVGGLVLVGAGAWYVSTKPGGIKGFIGMGARENPAKRSSRNRARRNPLKGGSSRATISANIRKLHHEHPDWAHNRIVAAALNNARRTSRGALPPYLRTG
jgi:hypothetical protein